MKDLKALAVKSVSEYITDEERRMLREAGYSFNIVRGPGIDRADILQHGRRVALVLNGKAKWY